MDCELPEELRMPVPDGAPRFDAEAEIRYVSRMCKITGGAFAFHACGRLPVMQIHGGIGLTADPPIEKLWRDTRSMVVTEGPPESLRMVPERAFYRE